MRKFVSTISAVALMFALSAYARSIMADNATAVSSDVSGLDLRALSALAQQAQSAAEFERLLNQEGSPNNLDLDHDGYVDYLQVEEYESGNVRGFNLLDDGQWVARVEVERTAGGMADVRLEGNPAVYGDGEYDWNWQCPLDEYPLFSELWMPGAEFYVSPWGMGFYPGWYSHYRPVLSREMYSQRIRGYNWYRPGMHRYDGRRYPNRYPGRNYSDRWRNEHRTGQSLRPRQGPSLHLDQGQLGSRSSRGHDGWRPSPHETHTRGGVYSGRGHSPQPHAGHGSASSSPHQSPHGSGQGGGHSSPGHGGRR